MNVAALPPLPEIGSEIHTACGGSDRFTADTPHALYGERWIFFCLPACKEDFECDPATSCLTSHQHMDLFSSLCQ